MDNLEYYSGRFGASSCVERGGGGGGWTTRAEKAAVGGGKRGDNDYTEEEYRPVPYSVSRAVPLSSPRISG